MSDAPAIDPSRYRTVLGHQAAGVVVVTAMGADGVPVGMTAVSFTSLSLDPPLVLFCATKTSTSWQGIKAAGHYCINVLSADQEELSRVFSSKAEDKFFGLGWKPGPSGAPVLDGVLAHIDCDLHACLDGGDHDIAVGRVLDLDCTDQGGPLVFFRGGYRQLSA